MKQLKAHSRLIPSLLLALLMVGILLIFLVYHNALVGANAKANETGAILFILLSAAIAVALFLQTTQAISKNQGLSEEVASLKRTIKASQQKKEVIETTTEITIDANAEADKLIPNPHSDDQISFLEKLLSNIAKQHDIVQGLVYLKDHESGIFSFTAGYAFYTETAPPTYTEGETLSGQVAKNKTLLNISDIPTDYITILSGLGKGSPKHLLIIPILGNDDQTIGIIELASFSRINTTNEEVFALLGKKLGALISNTNKLIEE
ncbi:MAG: GAF domain-containing protein [Bacteroidales bacterium]|nr:GAF domain-containing protein [Bacteroidales bacterium]MBN2749694.1 GAF domain-containing protein [Bacteroidales bacterium]